MKQQTCAADPPAMLLQLDDLELQALDQALQAGLADRRHPILRDCTDVLLPLHRKVRSFIQQSAAAPVTPR